MIIILKKPHNVDRVRSRNSLSACLSVRPSVVAVPEPLSRGRRYSDVFSLSRQYTFLGNFISLSLFLSISAKLTIMRTNHK